MDLLAHIGYGATFCSRTGLAGGRKGASVRRWYRDGTLWLTVLFSLLPDMVSMWIPFAVFMVGQKGGNFFAWYGGGWLEVYRVVHSVVPALTVAVILFICCRKFFAASLAWTVHIVCDTVSHDGGKYSTMPFYPLSDFNVVGIAFWRNSWFVMSYWALLPIIWLCIWAWRRGRQKKG